MNILHVISSPRAESFSIRLANGIIDKLQRAHPGSTVQVRDLATHPFPHLEAVHIQSFRTPAEERTPEQVVAVHHSDTVVSELQQADTIVIGAPLYNFGIPSTLKAWIDHVVRARVTFRYTASGMEGLLTGKKVYVALSSGGIYSEGPWMANDFVAPYLKAVLAGIGLTDITVVRVENTSQADGQDESLNKALSSVSLSS